MSADEPISDQQLRALLEGSLSLEEVTRLEGLLEADARLRERLEALAGASEFETEIAPDSDSADEVIVPEADPEVLSKIMGSLKTDTELRPLSPSPVGNLLGPLHAPGAIGSLGPYEVEGHLATGGMGVVYKAHDPQLKRPVAIKVLSPYFAGQDEAMQRFLREATAAAAIEHPHVLPIHAIDTESAELPFLVLRYVDGPSVEKLIAERKGPLGFPQVLAIAKAVASALAAAHAKNLTHRDVKPSNILLETEGEGEASNESQTIYLTDFGLARLAGDSAVTRSGTYLGTPHFSSPEQARGEACDHRSDLFSLGAVLYNMATGVAPFSREDNAPSSVIYRVVHENHPPAQSANPALPGWFSELIDRLLSKDPELRPSSAGAVLRCLEAESLDSLSGEGQRSVSRKVFAMVGLLAVLGVAGLFTFLSPPGANRDDAALSGDGKIVLIGEDDSRKSFADLAEAISNASGRSVIEIAHTGVLESAPLVVPEGLDLTIRPAPGHHPILSTNELQTSVLTSRSDLALEGLTIQGQRPTPQSPPLIKILEGAFRMVGCRLEVPSNVPPRKRKFTLNPALIETSGTPRLQVENCELIGAGSAGIRYVGTVEVEQPKIEIRNNLVVAYSGLELLGGAAGDDGIDVILERNFMVGRRPLFFFTVGQPFPCSVHVSDSLFSSDTTVVATPLRMRDLFEYVSWSSANNVYSATTLVQSQRGGAPGLTSMTQFKTLFEDDRGSEQRDLAYRKHVGQYLLEPTKIRAALLSDVPPPESPLPTTGPHIDRIGPGAPYHQWRAGQ